MHLIGIYDENSKRETVFRVHFYCPNRNTAISILRYTLGTSPTLLIETSKLSDGSDVTVELWIKYKKNKKGSPEDDTDEVSIEKLYRLIDFPQTVESHDIITRVEKFMWDQVS